MKNLFDACKPSYVDLSPLDCFYKFTLCLIPNHCMSQNTSNVSS